MEKIKEAKAKTNPDYTASAKDLSNPVPTFNAYDNWKMAKDLLEKAELEIEAKIPTELITARDKARELVDSAYNALKEAVINYGGFQNIEAGEYALQQRRASKSYNVEPFKMHFGEWTPMVLVEAIDVKNLESLIKDGKLKETDLKERGVVTEKESFAYIIK
jgi:hypothetical protein